MKSFSIHCLAAVAIFFSAHGYAAERTYNIDMVQGKANAPLTIIEFGSTTCLACSEFHKNIMPKLKAEWIDTGRAKLIFRDYPSSPLSMGASMIAHCAGQDRYFDVLDRIMAEREQWVAAPDKLDALKKVVNKGGVSSDAVDACLKRRDLANSIDERVRGAVNTYQYFMLPAVVIDGRVISPTLEAGLTYEMLDSALRVATK